MEVQLVHKLAPGCFRMAFRIKKYQDLQLTVRKTYSQYKDMTSIVDLTHICEIIAREMHNHN